MSRPPLLAPLNDPEMAADEGGIPEIHYVRPRYRASGRQVAIKSGAIVAAICGKHVSYPDHASMMPSHVTCADCRQGR